MTVNPAALRPLATLAICALVMLGGCAKKPKTSITPPPATGQLPSDDGKGSNSGTTENPDTGGTAGEKLKIADVFFDYDRFALRDDARDALNNNGRLMLESSATRFVLEGHCDERGTTEYNLALGEKRASAAKEYLVRYGVDGSRLSTVSYGEEQPFDPGHDEAAWEANRRVHFVQQ